MSTIEEFHNGKISELAYLTAIRQLRDRMQHRNDGDEIIPEPLRRDPHAQAFWGIARRNLDKAGTSETSVAADIPLEISKIVQSRRKVGWQNDRDVENLIRNDIDDFFFEELRGRRGVILTQRFWTVWWMTFLRQQGSGWRNDRSNTAQRRSGAGRSPCRDKAHFSVGAPNEQAYLQSRGQTVRRSACVHTGNSNPRGWRCTA